MKRKIPSALSLALLLVVGLQCKKEKDPSTVETWGYIIDEVTREPVEGVKVLFYNSLGPTSMALYSTLVDSTYTDANGFFKKKWTLTKKYAQMSYFKEGYYHYKDLRQNAKGDIGVKTIKPNKNFRLHIKNVPPVREDDSLYVNIRISSDGNYRSMPPRWFVGDYDDTLVNVRIAYDEPYWWISYHFKDDDGYWHYYSEFPPCTPLDTCDIHIEF